MPKRSIFGDFCRYIYKKLNLKIIIDTIAPLWSNGQDSSLSPTRSGFDSLWRCHFFLSISSNKRSHSSVGLERTPNKCKVVSSSLTGTLTTDSSAGRAMDCSRFSYFHGSLVRIRLGGPYFVCYEIFILSKG